MSVDGEFRKLLVAATAMAIVALLAAPARAADRQTDGWLHGAEAPTGTEATDGWLHSMEAQGAAEVTDGWLHSMQAPVGADVTDGWLHSIEAPALAQVTDGWASSDVRYQAPDGGSRFEVDHPVAGRLHSDVLEIQRPSELARSRPADSPGISIDFATGSIAALLIGFAFAALLIARRSRHVNPA